MFAPEPACRAGVAAARKQKWWRCEPHVRTGTGAQGWRGGCAQTKNGGPARTSTWNQTVMSRQL